METPGTAHFHRIVRLCTCTTFTERSVPVTSHRTQSATKHRRSSYFRAFSVEFRRSLSYISRYLLAVFMPLVEIKQIKVSVKIKIPGKNYVTGFPQKLRHP